MRRARRRLALGVGAVLVGVLAAAGGDALAAGRPPRKARPGLEAKQEALGTVRRRLDAARERASAARQREVSLLSELERIDRALADKQRAVRGLDRRIARVEADLDALEGRRDRVAEDVVTQQAALSLRVGALARLAWRPAPPPWVVDPAARPARQAVGDLARIARDDLARLARSDETAEKLAARQELAARARGELVRLRRRIDTERATVAATAERRRRLLEDVREDRATHERVAAELAEAARRLEALVRALARRPPARKAVARPSAPAPPPGPAVGLGRERGQLPWPADGRVIAGFGREIHPRFGTETLRTGIDIAAAEGAPIRAVAAGTVAYRGWLRGYGNLVVLDHGDGYHTLYAHASDVLVDEGDQVKRGELIGRVGESGSVEGPRLHFEVRNQSRAEDPRIWLRPR
jgi:septal ring factor EnvC (AmiA/AmiB activator)